MVAILGQRQEQINRYVSFYTVQKRATFGKEPFVARFSPLHMNSNDIKEVTLLLNTAQAAQKLDDINRRLVIARQKRQEAFEKGDGKALQAYTKEIKSLEAQAARMQSRAQTVEKVLKNLDHATPKELKASIREINRELNSGNIERGSKQWNVLSKTLAEAQAELKKIKDEQRAAINAGAGLAQHTQSIWQRIATIWSNSPINQAVTAFNTLRQSIQPLVTEYADMAEHTSGVIKYTGLAKEEVDQLNETFKQIDTRTPREKLNDLAADAGRLGIQSKDAVLDFVEAADQINTALGEDLGEDAVKNIGKLAQMFGTDKTMGLKQAMLSTASVINELAQSSSASEGYIMEFTNRLAGVGNQAGMTQAQIMGLASVLDQNQVNVEKGATALQNVLTALFKEPEKMAKAAGLEVKSFTKLLSTDANAALIQFLQALNNAGGMDKLAPILAGMNLSGAGVTQTLSTLAGKLADVKTAQEQAAVAFQEGTSCTNEANQANHTAQAEIEKAQKRMKDLRVELGERLYPVYTSTAQAISASAPALRSLTNLLGIVARVIATLITFTADHARAIITATAAIVAFNAAMKLNITFTKIQTIAIAAYNTVVNVGASIKRAWTAATTAATTAQIAFNTAIKKNGFAAFISLILSAIAAIATWLGLEKLLTSATNDATDAQQKRSKALTESQQQQELAADAQKQAAQAVAQEKAQIQALTALIHDNTASIADRRAAIEKLQKIVPGYQATLRADGTLFEKNTGAIADYIAQLDRLALAQALFAKIQENLSKQIDIDRTVEHWKEVIAWRDKQLGAPLTKTVNYNNPSLNETVTLPGSKEYQQHQSQNKERLAAWQKASDANKAELKFLYNYAKQHGAQGELNKLIANGGKPTTTPSVNVTPTTTTANGGSSTGANTKTGTKTNTPNTDHTKAQLKALEEHADRQRIIARASYENGIIDHREYTAQLLDIDQKLYTDQRNLYTENSPEWVKLEQKRYDATAAVRKNNHAWSIHELDIEEQAELKAEKKKYLDGITNEQQYQSNKTEIKLRYLQRRANLSKLYGQEDEANKYQQQYDEQNEADQLARKKEFWQRVDQFRKEWLAKSAAEQQTDELNFAKKLHEDGILSEKEYKKAKAEIAKKYSKDNDTDQYKLKNPLGSSTDAMSQGVAQLAASLSSLQLKLKDGEAAWQDYAAVGVAALSTVSAMLSSVSQLYQAQQQEEEARVTARYDAEIKAAGSNSARAKKLEEQKQKETAAIKNKYNRKMQTVELAQAVAQTAMNAIMAYGSVVRIPIVGPIMAVAAAAAALAAGAIQIAAIKKQHAAQAAGYYEGGFTGGTAYHREAGVVHQGEFVANHQAVRNPALLPLLQLIDHAQRTNRVASLTPADVSRAIAAPMATSIATTQTANSPALQITTEDTNQQTQTLNRLSDQIDQGITAIVTIDGPQGLDRQYRHYKRLNGQA